MYNTAMKKLLTILFCLLLSTPAYAGISVSASGVTAIQPSVTSLGIAQYLRNIVNVSQPPYSAKCDGTTDDTAAFTAALATGFLVYVPQTTTCCAVNNLALPSNSSMFGDTGPWYSTTSGARSCITGTAAATVILNPNGSAQATLSNLDIIGSTSGSFTSQYTCIKGGSTNLTLFDMSVRYCGNGGLGDTVNQTATANVTDVTFYANGQTNSTANVINLVDSHVNGGYVTSGYHGFYFPSGSNDNDIQGVKVEYNIQFGYLFDTNSGRNNIRGGVCDNNAYGCLRFNGAFTTQVGPMVMYRNGRGTTSGVNVFNYGQRQHIYFNGAASNIVLTGIVTRAGLNDGGSGTLGPPQSIVFNAATDKDISIGDSDFTGNTGAPLIFTSSVPKNLMIKNVTGIAQSLVSGEQDITGEVVLSALATAATPVITNAGATGAATWTYKVVAFTSTGYHSDVSAGGSTATGNATLTASNYNIITITPVTGATYYQIYRTAVGTSPSTTGLIGTIYEGTTTLNDTGLAGDSATASTVNTSGSLVFPSTRTGTFVCTGAGTISIGNTTMLATSSVLISMNAQGGTITTPPAMKTVTAGTGFSVLCGATDTSTYNYNIIN